MIVVGSKVRIKVGTPRPHTAPVPNAIVGKEATVEAVNPSEAGTSISSYRVHCELEEPYVGKIKKTYYLFPDEVEEITKEPIKVLLGYCDHCRETLTPHKKAEKCTHIVYMCCDCKGRVRKSCTDCQAKNRWYSGSLDTFDYNYD